MNGIKSEMKIKNRIAAIERANRNRRLRANRADAQIDDGLQRREHDRR